MRAPRGCGQSSVLQGGALVLFQGSWRHPDTYFKDMDVKHKVLLEVKCKVVPVAE
jgi:hypothetical protein